MSNREKVYTYVLAVLIGLMVALVFLAFSNYGAYAEDEDPCIVYTYYNGAEIFGIVEAPGGGYFARIGMHTGEQCTYVFAAIFPPGEFRANLEPCEYVTVEIVTEPYSDAAAIPCFWTELVW